MRRALGVGEVAAYATVAATFALATRSAVGGRTRGQDRPGMPGRGTDDDPWVLRTPRGSSEYTMYRDDDRDPASAGSTV
jgi:hypothetical protein